MADHALETLDDLRISTVLGQGTFGCVRLGRDATATYAVKMSPLNDDDEGIPASTMREYAICKRLYHPNVLQILREPMRFDTFVCLVFERCDANLKAFMRERGGVHETGGVAYSDMQWLTVQLLRGVTHMHARGYLHRDIKPANLLVNRGYPLTLRIGDLGLARAFWNDCDEHAMTLCVCTLWYKPIDLLLGRKTYGFDLDMWSVGCVVAEIATGTALFRGNTSYETILEILKHGGAICPRAHPELVCLEDYSVDLPKFRRSRALFDPPLTTFDARDVQELVDALLSYAPQRRPSARECLRYPFCLLDARPSDRGTSVGDKKRLRE